MDRTPKIYPNYWFFGFIICHIFFWTLMPSIARLNLPLDAMEGTTWGMQLQWGYDKDPLLNAWLTRLAMELGNYREWVIYGFSQLAVAIGMIAIWQLAKKFLPPLSAVVAVVILEGIQYYNVAAIDFNDNVLQVMLWPLLSLALYNAAKLHQIRYWMAVGITAALAFLAKYYAIMLFFPAIVFLIINSQARLAFKKPGFYLALIIFSVLLAPHIYWLLHHDFLTVRYSFNQAAQSNNTIDHLWQPIRFGIMQAAAFILPGLLFSCLLIGREKVFKTAFQKLTLYDKQFLFSIGFGPLLCNILYSVVTGNSIHVLWGMPLLGLWGIILVSFVQVEIITVRFYRLIILVTVVIMLAGAFYNYQLTTAQNTSSANYPGKIIAKSLTKIWQQHSSKPFKYIAGPRWIAGNVAFYSDAHPRVYMESNSQVSTWIDEADLKRNGALFIWDADYAPEISPELLQRYPALKILPSANFAWLRTAPAKNINLGIAILLPQLN